MFQDRLRFHIYNETCLVVEEAYGKDGYFVYRPTVEGPREIIGVVKFEDVECVTCVPIYAWSKSGVEEEIFGHMAKNKCDQWVLLDYRDFQDVAKSIPNLSSDESSDGEMEKDELGQS